MTDVVSVGDLTGTVARTRRADWMTRFDVGQPPPRHPAPVVPARLAVAGEVPASAAALADAAVKTGWSASVVYAAGTAMDARGRPAGLVESVSVRCWRRGGQRAVACWLRPLPAGNWRADSGWVWRTGQIPRKVGVDATSRHVSDRPPAAPRAEQIKGACESCGQPVAINKDGTLRVHGPRDGRCGGRRAVAVTTSPSSST